MNAILTYLANMICNYGKWGAGLLSNHGMHEFEVPEELMNTQFTNK